MPLTRKQAGRPIAGISVRQMLAMDWCKSPDWGRHEYEHQHQQCCAPAPKVDNHGGRIHCIVRLITSVQQPVMLQQAGSRRSAGGQQQAPHALYAGRPEHRSCWATTQVCTRPQPKPCAHHTVQRMYRRTSIMPACTSIQEQEHGASTAPQVSRPLGPPAGRWRGAPRHCAAPASCRPCTGSAGSRGTAATAAARWRTAEAPCRPCCSRWRASG
jgi:hypothetical protein